MNKFDKVFRSIIKEDVAKYIFNDNDFDRAWRQTWDSSQREQMQRFFKKGTMPVSRIKSIFKEICKAVSDGKNAQAFQLWRKVGTDGFLFRLMWAQGWDCAYPRTMGDTGTLRFIPKIMNESVTENNIIKEYRVKKTFDCRGFEDWCKKELRDGERLYCSLRNGTIYVQYYKTRYSQYLGDEDKYTTQCYYNKFNFKNGEYMADKSYSMTGTGFVSSCESQILYWIQKYDPKCKLPIYIDAEVRG